MKANKLFIVISVVLAAFVISGCSAQSEQTTAADRTIDAPQEAEMTAPEMAAPAETQTQAQTETQAPIAAPHFLYALKNLTIRAAADKDSDKIGIVPIGSAVILLCEGEEYYQILFEDTEGYVLGSYLTDNEAEAAEAAEQAAKEARQEEEDNAGGEHQGMADMCNMNGLTD